MELRAGGRRKERREVRRTRDGAKRELVGGGRRGGR